MMTFAWTPDLGFAAGTPTSSGAAAASVVAIIPSAVTTFTMREFDMMLSPNSNPGIRERSIGAARQRRMKWV
jgi:hypothetical protein